MSRGKIVSIITVLMIALIGVYLKRDLALTGDVFRNKLPPMMVERLEFARRINGMEWHIKAENAESDGETVRASSIDIKAADIDASRSADVYAARGAFDLVSDKMWLYNIAGIVYLSGGSIDIAASRADYDMSDDVWFFSEGISASDGKIHVTGRVGKIESSGVVTLGKGVHASWQLE
ncbi:MAG: hypothetical protein LBS35_07745 [Synergistaceae bacterium]|nr:hypothetical protein [Synergistaceae bacterium]